MGTNRGRVGSRTNRKSINHPVYYVLVTFKGILRRLWVTLRSRETKLKGLAYNISLLLLEFTNDLKVFVGV